MIRKRTKNLVNLGLSKNIAKDVILTPDDGLPPYAIYFVCHDSHGLPSKVWLGAPTQKELKNARKRKNIEAFRNISIDKPIVPGMIGAGFSELFAQQVARLVIHNINDIEVSRTHIKNIIKGIIILFETLSNKHGDKRKRLTINNLTAEDFIGFRESIQKKEWQKKNKLGVFNTVKRLFSHQAVDNHIQLQNVRGNFKDTKICNPKKDLTSPLFINSTYSDSVMFQLLCYFIFYFERHIEHLREYENLTEDNVLLESGNEIIRPDELERHERRRLILKWLSNEAYYPVIAKHELLWQKLWGLSFFNSNIAVIYRKRKDHDNPYRELVDKYKTWANEFYSVPSRLKATDNRIYRVDIPAIHCKELLAKKSSGSRVASIKNRTGYCLVNLIMMSTGLNREVVLSWDSRLDGSSILQTDDNLFISKKPNTTQQTLIHGVKNKRGGRVNPKPIDTTIPRSSPLYRMLKEYEEHLKTDIDGKFFEFSKTFAEEWCWRTKEGDEDLFSKIYPVRLEKGTLLQTLDTRKFRKVFGKARLFSLMNGVKNPLELAEKIQDAFRHGDLDTTLSNYLLKDSDARSAIDLAIVTITNAKLKELSFSGQVDVSGKKKGRKDVFLCECEDPSNPTHEFSIADECVKYDLCLGCQRSIIHSVHLPYICGRILQYEEFRKITDKWSAFFEDRWLIAHDALKQYEEADRINGKKLIDEAWKLARDKSISLPPITMPELD